jgi:hypothetical protein
MIKKMIVLLAAVIAFSVVADYLGIIHISAESEKPKVLEITNEYVLKTSKNIEKNSILQ